MGFAYSRETYCLTVQVSSLLAQVSLCPRSEFCHPFFVETWLRRSRSTGKTSSRRVLWSSSPSISRNGGRDGSLALEVSMSFFSCEQTDKNRSYSVAAIHWEPAVIPGAFSLRSTSAASRLRAKHAILPNLGHVENNVYSHHSSLELWLLWAFGSFVVICGLGWLYSSTSFVIHDHEHGRW